MAQAYITDQDNNVIPVVKIGEHYWTTENLKVKTYNDGTPIETNFANTKGAYYPHHEHSLYNWFAVRTGKLAPIGCHIPCNIDFESVRHSCFPVVFHSPKYRYSPAGDFTEFCESGMFWSSDLAVLNKAWYWYVYPQTTIVPGLLKSHQEIFLPLSVRCVVDNLSIILP